MLLSFTVDNFKSFNRPSKLTMFKGNVQKKKEHLMRFAGNDVLKGAAIYGTNSGGKTSFIDALDVSRTLVLSDNPMGNQSDTSIADMYCRIDENNRTRPTSFGYIFETEGRCYRYDLQVTLNEHKLISESLYEGHLEEDRFTKIFERNGKEEISFNQEFFSPEEYSKLEGNVSDMDVSTQATLIFMLSFKKKYPESSNLRVFTDVRNWFDQKLIINSGNVQTKEEMLNSSSILKHLIPDMQGTRFEIDENIPKQFVETGTRYMKEFGMKSLAMADLCLERNGDSYTGYRMKFAHDSTDSLFNLSDESAGTIETLLYSPMLAEDDSDITYVIDEFGHSMHPLLAKRFIELFFATHEDDRIQLIIATHQILLMTLSLFRMDEIWFIDKEKGESELYSLSEFQPRSDVALDRNYLSGRYGALPLFDEW
ncbi:MAG: ATP-binding protein [Thermoplasmata archaeon]|nr:ATP-binding protein [Thermoplasmata archaeon]